ncbi:MAG: hypothetical protein FWG84_10005, partial [Bacteroidales bacterium]|nr:hypothetical protein [Bacteroidales bacterium]
MNCDFERTVRLIHRLLMYSFAEKVIEFHRYDFDGGIVERYCYFRLGGGGGGGGGEGEGGIRSG